MRTVLRPCRHPVEGSCLPAATRARTRSAGRLARRPHGPQPTLQIRIGHVVHGRTGSRFRLIDRDCPVGIHRYVDRVLSCFSQRDAAASGEPSTGRSQFIVHDGVYLSTVRVHKGHRHHHRCGRCPASRNSYSRSNSDRKEETPGLCRERGRPGRATPPSEEEESVTLWSTAGAPSQVGCITVGHITAPSGTSYVERARDPHQSNSRQGDESVKSPLTQHRYSVSEVGPHAPYPRLS